MATTPNLATQAAYTWAYGSPTAPAPAPTTSPTTSTSALSGTPTSPVVRQTTRTPYTTSTSPLSTPTSPVATQTTRNPAPTPAPTTTQTPAPAPAPTTQLPPGTPQIITNAQAGSAIKGQWVDMGGGVFYDTATGNYRNYDGTVTGSSVGAVLQYTNPYEYVNGGYLPPNILQNNQNWSTMGALGGVPLDINGNPSFNPNTQPMNTPIAPGVLSAPGPPTLASYAPGANAYASPTGVLAPGGIPSPQVLPQGVNLGLPGPLGNSGNYVSPLGSANFGSSGANLGFAGSGLGPYTEGAGFYPKVGPYTEGDSFYPSLPGLLGITGFANPGNSNPLSGLGMFNSPDQVVAFMSLLGQLLGMGNQQGKQNNPFDNYALYGPAPDIRKNLYPIFP